jgi:hypothetical protein
MNSTQPSAIETLHRLLFRALLEIRSEGQEQKNKVVFHLADLFHTIVLEMENAARGEITYEDVLKALEARAGEKGLSRWLGTNRDAIRPPTPSESVAAPE